MNPFIIFSLVLLLCMIPAILFSVFLYWKNGEIVAENDILSNQQELYIYQYEIIRNQIEVTRKLNHDVLSHINTMKVLAAKELSIPLQQYCSKLEEKHRNFIRIGYCSDPIVDAVLYNKIQQCLEFDIELQLEVANVNFDCIDKMDIVSLLENILNNAIESCLRVEEIRRHIEVNGTCASNYIIMVIKNAKPKCQLEDVQHKTLKKDKNNHGLGLEIVENIVKKYDGSIIYQEEEGFFITMVSLRMIETI